MDAKRQTDEADRVKRLLALDRSTLPADGGPGFNRLVFASSPYLLQHAENPVDWYPWGEEAFARARAEGKPVLVSIGYATCHWCHVMAHESFEDVEVAAALLRNCIAIKVDREERPDIDAQYMLAAQLLTGSGGWPLNVFLTPEKEPFLATTYLPKLSRGGALGLIDYVERIGELWRRDRSRLMQNRTALAAAMAAAVSPAPAGLSGPELLLQAAQQLTALYDPDFKGFGAAPKFPMPVNLSFLLHIHARQPQSAALPMVAETFRALRSGGICDQIGGGFHRYSVDRAWLVPHFEKMLYDQALLASAAIEAYQATADDWYRRFAAEIITYVLRDLAAPPGGFHAAEDADSAGAEGTFYLWTPQELRDCLGDEAEATAAALFDVTTQGNFEGKNILHLPLPPDDFARRNGVAPELFAATLAGWRERLLAVRSARERPFRDEKILTAWNGLMLVALAKGFGATGETTWLEAAQGASSRIRQHLVNPAGRLLRSWNAGAATIPAFLEDYAFYVWGLIELHQATLNAAFLQEALRLCQEMLRLFAAPEGGLFEVGADAAELPVRMQSASDGVLPSGASVAALNLLRLGRIAEDEELSTAGEKLLRTHMGQARRQPAGYTFLLRALDFALGPPLEVTLGGGNADARAAILRTLGRRFLPALIVRSGPGSGPLRVEVCAAGACRPAAGDIAGLERLLDEVAPRTLS